MKLTAILVVAGLVYPAFAQSIAGKVVEDHSGIPLASAEVRIARIGARFLAADLETDSEGRFRGPELEPGDYRIEIQKPNYAGATLRLRAPVEGGPLLVRLVRFGVISGQVTDQEGRPVHGAAVFVMAKPGDGGPLRPLSAMRPGSYAQVDQRGQYRLYNLPPGQYAVAATYGASTFNVGSTGSGRILPGVGSGAQFYPANAQPRILTISGGEQFRNVDFSIHPSTLYQVSGKLDLPEGATGTFWLALTPVDQPALAAAAAQSEKDGAFRFDGVPPGSYYLFASGPSDARTSAGGIPGPNAWYGRTRVELTVQNLENVPVALEKGRSAAILLRSAVSQGSESACPANAQVTLRPVEDWAARLERTVEVGSAKEQTVANLAPARYRVSVGGLGDTCYDAANQILDLTRTSDAVPVTVLVAPAGAIRGRLTGAVRPTDYAVLLVPADPAETVPPVQLARPDAQARFAFAGLAPGRYFIAAQPATDTAKVRWIPDLGRMVAIEVPGGTPTELELPAPVEGAPGR